MDLYNEIKSLKETPRDYKIYSYHFSDGKIYIGYTHGSLEQRHNQHKRIRYISPITNFLNSNEPYEGPTYEETVTVTLASGEIYKSLRKILDKYTTDTKKILNRNLYLYGY